MIKAAKVSLLITLAFIQPALGQETSKEISVEFLGRAVVASRDCGEGTSFPPQLVSVYIQQFADQEGISFEKAKYIAISRGDDFLSSLITSGKKDDFCLRVIE
jgi:hypothetical protein